ncbi:MAG: T9SS type A sorting domain-containing protein, partial [Bacteroidetes bacterium]|nr:T9SS type A sorting domain-containing protein [Bacteroidota bacterium]
NNFEERDMLFVSNHNIQFPVSLTLIEGVGSLGNPFGPVTYTDTVDQRIKSGFCCPDHLICLTVDNGLVYVFNDESRCSSLEVWSEINTHNQNPFYKTYPNPAKDKLIIDFQIKTGSIIDVVIYNIHGNVAHQAFYRLNNTKLTIPLENYKSGIYFLDLKTENNHYSSKFLIIK